MRVVVAIALLAAVDAAVSTMVIRKSMREYFDEATTVFRAVVVHREPAVYKEGPDGLWFFTTPVRYRLLERFKGAVSEQGVVYDTQAFFAYVGLYPHDEFVIHTSDTNYALPYATFDVRELHQSSDPKVEATPQALENFRKWAKEPGSQPSRDKRPACRTRPVGNSTQPYFSQLHPLTKQPSELVWGSMLDADFKILSENVPKPCR